MEDKSEEGGKEPAGKYKDSGTGKEGDSEARSRSSSSGDEYGVLPDSQSPAMRPPWKISRARSVYACRLETDRPWVVPEIGDVSTNLLPKVAADLINSTLQFTSTFRLEVILQPSGKWTLVAQVPAQKWFLELESLLGASKALERALAYEEILLGRMATSFHSAPLSTSCTSSTTSASPRKYVAPKRQVDCKYSVSTLDGQPMKCEWVVKLTREVQWETFGVKADSVTPEFIFYTRKHPYSEILCSPRFHYETSVLPKLPPFWGLVERIQNESLFQGHLKKVIFNFGNWESAIATDSILSGCHGHAHLIFDPKVMGLLSQTKGKIAPIPSYGQEDLTLLQSILNARRMVRMEAGIEASIRMSREARKFMYIIVTLIVALAAIIVTLIVAMAVFK